MPHNLHYAIHLSHLYETEYRQVFIFRTIRALGASLISVFIPIYLYQLSGEDIGVALPKIVIYFSSLFILRGLSIVPCINLISKIGGKHVLVLSAFFDAAAYILLSFLDSSPLLLVPIALLLGVGSASFFTALHMELSFSTGERKARQVSSIEISRKVTMSLGPLLGGVIAANYGLVYAGLIASALFLISIIPLHLSSEPLKKSPGVDLNKLRRLLKVEPTRVNFGMAFNTISAGLLWPLFIYLVIGSYEKVGLIISTSLIASLCLMHTIGRKESNDDINKELKTGSTALAITHFVRVFVTNPLTIGMVNLFNDLSYSLVVIPYTAQYYRNASLSHRASYIAATEIYYSLGSVVVWPLLYVVYTIAGDIKIALFCCFIVAAIGIAGSRHITQPFDIEKSMV